ncbi:hypothetical protein HAX54_036123, partial [Datura stramonium]|nr:hypothetical protein [Datura stramonium]
MASMSSPNILPTFSPTPPPFSSLFFPDSPISQENPLTIVNLFLVLCLRLRGNQGEIEGSLSPTSSVQVDLPSLITDIHSR